MAREYEASLPIVQGANLRYKITWSVDGVPVDLSSGYTAACQVRNGIDGSTAILSLTSGAGTITLSALGVIYLLATAAVTAAITGLETGDGVWDLEITETATGFVTNLIGGPVNFTQEVTR